MVIPGWLSPHLGCVSASTSPSPNEPETGSGLEIQADSLTECLGPNHPGLPCPLGPVRRRDAVPAPRGEGSSAGSSASSRGSFCRGTSSRAGSPVSPRRCWICAQTSGLRLFQPSSQWANLSKACTLTIGALSALFSVRGGGVASAAGAAGSRAGRPLAVLPRRSPSPRNPSGGWPGAGGLRFISSSHSPVAGVEERRGCTGRAPLTPVDILYVPMVSHWYPPIPKGNRG